MSKFTRNRKKIRKIKEITDKQKTENSKKFDKAMSDYLETIKIIKKDYPGYNNMSPDNALKVFNEVLTKIKGK